MKQNIRHFVIAVLAAACTAVSCDSFFDINTKDQATLEDIMGRSTAVRQYLAHLYSYIPQDENLRGNEGGTSLRSDEALHGKSQYETNWYKVRRGEYSSASATGVGSGNYWKKFYEAINECTTFIDNLHYDKEDSERLVACMEGEARFLRAYYYFCLFRHYGPVYLWMDENGDPVASDQGINGESMDRHTVDQNVAFMEKELDRAIALLPANISDVIAASSNTHASSHLPQPVQASLCTVGINIAYHADRDVRQRDAVCRDGIQPLPPQDRGEIIAHGVSLPCSG